MQSNVIEARDLPESPSSPVVATSKSEANPEASPTIPAPKASGEATAHTYVGSKNGTKYHLPTCSGAKNIKEENRIWFGSREEAEAKGYQPASNCKGI